MDKGRHNMGSACFKPCHLHHLIIKVLICQALWNFKNFTHGTMYPYMRANMYILETLQISNVT